MSKTTFALVAAAVLACPAAAEAGDESLSEEARLNACLQAGATSTTFSKASVAVSAVRARCGRYINRVRSDRVALATKGLEGDVAAAAKRREIQTLDREIALTIASYAGFNRSDLHR